MSSIPPHQRISADRDRNGRVSILEAFDYAKTKVTAAYEQSGNILTEHATLDDGAEGKLAATLFLAPQRSRSAEMANADPALRALVEQRDALERQIGELKLRKEGTDPAIYDQRREVADGAGAQDPRHSRSGGQSDAAARRAGARSQHDGDGRRPEPSFTFPGDLPNPL